MRSAALVHYGRTLLGLAAIALVGCGGDVGTSGSGGSSSSSGSSSSGSGSSSSGSGGGGAMCKNAVSGMATPVQIVLRNMGATDLGYRSVCGSAWAIEGPNGAHAPGGVYTLLCDEVLPSCPADCHEPGQIPVPAGTDAKFTWDGVLYEPVDAAANGCPAAGSGIFCPPKCSRRVDAPPGMYTVKGYLYPLGQAAITKTATIMYPSQTSIELVFP